MSKGQIVQTWFTFISPVSHNVDRFDTQGLADLDDKLTTSTVGSILDDHIVLGETDKVFEHSEGSGRISQVACHLDGDLVRDLERR